MRVRVNPAVSRIAKEIKFDLPEWTRVAEKVDRAFARDSRRLFATEGRSGGAKWRKLSDAYAKAKRKTHPGRKILTRDGELRDSLGHVGNENHSLKFGLRPRPFIDVGTEIPYAVYHQKGSGRLPKRNPIQRTRRQAQKYAEIIKEAHDRLVRRWSRKAGRWK